MTTAFTPTLPSKYNLTEVPSFSTRETSKPLSNPGAAVSSTMIESAISIITSPNSEADALSPVSSRSISTTSSCSSASTSSSDISTPASDLFSPTETPRFLSPSPRCDSTFPIPSSASKSVLGTVYPLQDSDALAFERKFKTKLPMGAGTPLLPKESYSLAKLKSDQEQRRLLAPQEGTPPLKALEEKRDAIISKMEAEILRLEAAAPREKGAKSIEDIKKDLVALKLSRDGNKNS